MVEPIIPMRFTTPEDSSGNWIRYIFYAVAILIIVVAGLAFLYAIVMEEKRFAPVYDRLGIEPLPKNIENMPYIKADLVKLMDAPCDRFNSASLADSLDNIGQNEWAKLVRRAYLSQCTKATPVKGPEAALNDLAINGTDPEIRRLARQLQGNLCNQPALLSLQFKLRDTKNIIAQAALGDAYLARCGLDNDIAYNIMIAHFNLGQYETSLAMARQNDQVRPNTAYWPAWIGKSLMKLKRPSEAADAFLKSLSQWGTPANTVYAEFWNAADALRAAGRYCEAMKPLEWYVSFDPVNRLTSNVQSELTSLAMLGNCS